MKHISKFDNGTIYEVTESMTYEDGQLKRDDIQIIWRYAPCGFDTAWNTEWVQPQEIVNFYYGDYDYDITEEFIKEYWKKKIAEKPTEKKIDVPICFINMIEACLETIKQHDLFSLVYGTDDKDFIENCKMDLDTVLKDFVKPLTDLDEDKKIIID